VPGTKSWPFENLDSGQEGREVIRGRTRYSLHWLRSGVEGLELQCVGKTIQMSFKSPGVCCPLKHWLSRCLCEVALNYAHKENIRGADAHL